MRCACSYLLWQVADVVFELISHFFPNQSQMTCMKAREVVWPSGSGRWI